jgi:hypothetical protein
MGFRGRIEGAIAAAVAIAIVVAGCGGSSANSNETEASRSFLAPGQKNNLPKFGEESDEDEREAASEVLEENLEARAVGEWAKQCASLTKGTRKEVEEEISFYGGKNQNSCARSLSAQARPMPATRAIRSNTLTGPIDALRVKGERGYALYHGTQKKDYAMPMEKEEGEWKVDALTTKELP